MVILKKNQQLHRNSFPKAPCDIPLGDLGQGKKRAFENWREKGSDFQTVIQLDRILFVLDIEHLPLVTLLNNVTLVKGKDPQIVKQQMEPNTGVA